MCSLYLYFHCPIHPIGVQYFSSGTVYISIVHQEIFFISRRKKIFIDLGDSMNYFQTSSNFFYTLFFL